MNIFLLTSSTSASGGTRQALYLAQGFKARGHNVIFFTEEQAQQRALDPNMNWGTLPADKKKWRNAIEDAFPTDGSPVIVHAFHNAAVKRLAWWSLAWKKRNVVAVGHRGVIYYPHNPLPYWSTGIAAFIVNSKACAHIIKKYCLNKNKVHVVYNGIPLERISPTQNKNTVLQQLNIPTSSALTPITVFGTVSSGDSPIKGIQVALEAFAKAQLPNTYFVIIGITPEKWLPMCQNLGIEKQVRLIGKTENIADYLQSFDAFVLPSLTESMPNTLMEAISMGLPAIATTVGGVPELVDGNGILVPANNVNELCSAMQKMANDPEQRKIWAKKSLQIAPCYTLERRLVTIERIYQNLLRARNLCDD